MNDFTTMNDNLMGDPWMGFSLDPNGIDNLMNDWTIMSAMCKVLEDMKGSNLNKYCWQNCQDATNYLTGKLQMTPVQVLVLAMLLEEDGCTSWKKMGDYLGVKRLRMFGLREEAMELVKRRWANLEKTSSQGEIEKCCLSLEPGVAKALLDNKPYVPEKIEGLDMKTFVGRISRRLIKYTRNCYTAGCLSYQFGWVKQMVEANPQLTICRKLMKDFEFNEQKVEMWTLMMLFLADYCRSSENSNINASDIETLYEDDYETMMWSTELTDGEHPLMKLGYVEYWCEEGVAVPDQFKLSTQCKNEWLDGYKPHTSGSNSTAEQLLTHGKIKAKDLFYNVEDEDAIKRLTALLSQDKLKEVQKRLKEKGLRQGVACLFYGGPGVGKTETVLQIAKQTGRDIMQIDIAGLRDKYVGEGEKNIKSVFNRYREVCKNKKVTPILFFNEADGVFSKRTAQVDRAADREDNAMQNIILQELETLDGILIATTNLTGNLDSAFERRFLFKVNFHKPNTEVKAKIWMSMMGEMLSETGAYLLAEKYDFSGGQIENINRQATINYVITGEEPSLGEIEKYCMNELMDQQKCRQTVMGFNKAG